MNDESPLMGKHYEIVSIEPTEPPSGMEGSDWHQYVISFESSDTIQGYQQGKLRAVKAAVEALVAQLNERHLGKRGRVNLVPTPKKDASK